MSTVYIVLAVILVGLMMVGIFTLGALFAIQIITDAQDDARYSRLKQEYFNLAGYRRQGDPNPYVPPQPVVIPKRKTPRSRILPGMSQLDRLMHEGKRGTIMWRAGDRQNVG